jgi:hypothetical protein
MEAIEESICTLQDQCPVCKEQRSLSLKRDWLVKQLENDVEIKVASLICGHDWSIAPHARKNLRKALVEGIL